MKEKRLLEALGQVDNVYIEEAANPDSRRLHWAKWGVLAACIVDVTIFGIGILQSIPHTDVATLENEVQIVFAKSNAVGGTMSLDMDVDTRQLSEREAQLLFTDLPVTGNVIYKSSGEDTGSPQELVGFEGQIGNIKINVSTSDIQLLDTVIVGTESTTEIDGVGIVAGYFETEPNSNGKRYTIYYATFEIGGSKIYLENAGPADESEATKNQLAEVIQKLIHNGGLDLAQFLDGNSTGYAQAADIAPMVCVGRALYQIAANQPDIAGKESEFIYLGEIQSQVSSSQKPTEDFQANDEIIGSKVYRYGENVAVEIDGRYWVYELLYEYQK